MSDEIKAKLLVLYPEFTRVYGPYVQKDNDGRRIVNLKGAGRRRTISWPKAMMEVKLGRQLLGNEFVDHIDDDPTNDCYENFQILTPRENNIKAIIARGSQQETANFICPICSIPFTAVMSRVRHNQHSQNKAGPFCSKSCAGKYGDKTCGGKGSGGGRPRTITNDDIIKAKQLRQRGLMVMEIAEILCIHQTTASRMVNGHMDRFLSGLGEKQNAATLKVADESLGG